MKLFCHFCAAYLAAILMVCILLSLSLGNVGMSRLNDVNASLKLRVRFRSRTLAISRCCWRPSELISLAGFRRLRALYFRVFRIVSFDGVEHDVELDSKDDKDDGDDKEDNVDGVGGVNSTDDVDNIGGTELIGGVE